MFFIHFLFAMFFSLLVILVFSTLFRTKGPWNNLGLFFVVVFLATWAGGIWVYPVGPFLWGVSWLPFLLVGILVAFLLVAAAVVPPRRESTVELIDQEKEEAKAKFVFAGVTLFFATVVAVLIVAIMIRYFI